MLNPDYLDMLFALSEEGAEFLIVGAYAMAAHGVPRSTGDIDIWVRPERSNAECVIRAVRRFGAPLFGLTADDLALPDLVFQVGIAPRRIDLLTSIDGIDFVSAWKDRVVTELDSVQVYVLSRQHLILNKRASGRAKDLVDVEVLESQER